MKTLLCLLSMVLSAAAVAAQPTDRPAVDAPAARILVLVRHGHYVADPAIDENIGPGLSPLGVAQAQLAGARLAGLPVAFDARHVSPMQRARDTAAAIAASTSGPAFATVADLAECTPPTRRTEITVDESPGDLAACRERLERVFAQYFVPAAGRERQELFVCHGNVIRYLVTRALGVDSTAWLEMSVGHASITRIRVEPDGRFKVIAVGDVGHLPPNLLTGASGDPERRLAAPVLP
jgi:serine/threonine-protein phosphatase PGAM5